jgi:hypothetical protein
MRLKTKEEAARKGSLFYKSIYHVRIDICVKSSESLKILFRGEQVFENTAYCQWQCERASAMGTLVFEAFKNVVQR